MDAVVAAHVVGHPGEPEVDAPAARVPHRVAHRRVLGDVAEADPPRRPKAVEADDDRIIADRRLEAGQGEERADRDPDGHDQRHGGSRHAGSGEQDPDRERDRDRDGEPQPRFPETLLLVEVGHRRER